MQTSARYGLTFLTVLALVAWGTCPCFFAQTILGLTQVGEAAAPACCTCCGERPAETPPHPDDDCPCCSTVGSMHELPPTGTPVALEAPAVAFALPGEVPSRPERLDARVRRVMSLALAAGPPGVSLETVVLRL